MNPRPKVLVIAEAANPEWVSVPLVGWSLAEALREVAEIHLVTQIRNREAILRAGLVEGTDFTVIDSERLAAPLWKLASVLRMGEGKGWTIVQAISAVSYPYFEHLVWKRFGSRIVAREYDVVHRITPLSPTVVSPIARKCARAGIPFVLGPLNGGVPWPKAFDAERRQEREWLSHIRGSYKLLPGRNASLKAASAILVGSRHTESEVPSSQRQKTIYLPENAISTTRFSKKAAQTQGSPLRACFIGRLVPVKGLDMLLKAAAPLLRDGRMTLELIGDGPMMHALKTQAEMDGTITAVTFHGWLRHEQVQDVAATCALLAFPSVKDFGGGAVLEGMALGLAPLVLDYAGPGELVTDDTGYKVPLGTREDIIAGLRAQLEHLAAAPEGVGETGARARLRVHELFTWKRKAEQVAEVYDWVLGRRTARPTFF